MKELLLIIEADMKNEMYTLERILAHVAGKADVFSQMLGKCAGAVREQPGKAFHMIWEETFNDELKNNPSLSSMKREDIDLINKTGGNLVNASIKTQDAYFKILFFEYDGLMEKIKTEEAKKSKLYNSLGIMAGFLIAILLI